MSLIPPLLIAAASIALLAYIAHTLWRAWRGGASVQRSVALPLRDQWYLFLQRKRIQAFEVLLSSNTPLESSAIIKTYRAALNLSYLPKHEGTAEAIDSLHDTLTQMLLKVSERAHLAPHGLPALEELLTVRGALLIERCEVLASRGDIFKKQRDKGREPPAWAAAEFSKKIQHLEERLDSNRRAVETSIRDLYTKTTTVQNAHEVTYH
jgi:hypothetical protein